jgi:hypothetical protein
MNFASSITDVLVSLNWATAEEDYVPGKYIVFHFTLTNIVPPSFFG